MSNFFSSSKSSVYSLFAQNYDKGDTLAYIIFDAIDMPTEIVISRLSQPRLYIPLDKGQISDFLSFDCPDDFIEYALTLAESLIPDGYYLDDHNRLMPIPQDSLFCHHCECPQVDNAVYGDICQCTYCPIPQKMTFNLTTPEIRTILCGLQWSMRHHESLPDSSFHSPLERAYISDRHDALKCIFNAALGDNL